MEKFVGKKVKVETKEQEFEGMVLPSYDPSVFLIKLENGYNIGIDKKEIKSIKVIKKGKEEKKKAVEKGKEKKVSKKSKKLPLVSFIVTGGTIASRVDYETGAVKPLTKPEEIISVAPKLNELVRIKVINPFMEFSENINSEHYKKLALIAEKELNDKEVKGIVILAGTDTLHYIASALSFMLPNLNKPVVLTCAQRSIDRGSTDALLNLTCSCYIALSDIAEVTIVSHGTTSDDYCFCLRGTKARKMHTSRRDTFRPINTKPIATVFEDGKIKFWLDYNKRNDKKKVKAMPFFEEKVALIKWHPNADPKLIEFFRKEKYKGLVIEATGFGHIAIEGKYSWFDEIKKAVGKNMVVCFAPQTIYGSLNPNVYSTGRKLKESGVIYLKDMLPETAYIKLCWLLGQYKDVEKVKELMLKNFSNEINERLSEKDFLV